jgi:hypothetical protein
MRRFVVSGLVPCDPVELADRLLDAAAAPQIWPQIRQQTPDAAPGGWWECSVIASEDHDDAGGEPSTLRLRRTSPVEIQERSDVGTTVHRFLPANGGCLWSIESHGRRLPRETWAHFVRRRDRERHRAMGLVDTAASYYASLR